MKHPHSTPPNPGVVKRAGFREEIDLPTEPVFWCAIWVVYRKEPTQEPRHGRHLRSLVE
jgi:hypothetical protein